MSAPGSERRWSLEGARAVLPDVRRLTGRAVEKAEALASERGQPDADVARLEGRMRAVVEAWARQMEALGAEVKGLWLVDFDNGSGYYCWRWPEDRLEWFHGYEDGFAGRIRIH